MAILSEYEQFDATGLAELVAKGDVTPEDLLETTLDRVERRNLQLNAVVRTFPERARQRIADGLPNGPLRGVPFLLKDLGMAYQGEPLTGGSRSMRSFVPDYTATLAQRYETAGLVIFGKTNTPEFGTTPYTEPELFGITANPWDPSLSAGGSSGGAGAAVAAGMVPAAHASDGGGSIRIPASHCGLFGLKPTRGRTPSGPLVGESWFGFSISHVVTRSVRDSAALLDATAGPEVGDPYAAPPQLRPYVEELGVDPGKLTVGVVNGGILSDEDIHPECRRAVNDAVALLEEMGHRIIGVDLPVNPPSLIEAFLTLVAADVAMTIRQAAELAGKERPDPDEYELSNWVVGLVGKALTAQSVAEALFEVRTTGRRVGRAFEQFEVVVSSTMGTPPWPHGEYQPTAAERRLLRVLKRAPLRPALMAAFRELAAKALAPIPNTPLFNVTGQPAMSVPLHWTPEGLPVGVQFAGRFGDEATLFRLASQLEAARPWFDRLPPLVDGS